MIQSETGGSFPTIMHKLKFSQELPDVLLKNICANKEIYIGKSIDELNRRNKTRKFSNQ